MTRCLYMGIDPGFTGAIGVLSEVEGEWLARVLDMPLRQKPGAKRICRATLAAHVLRLCGEEGADRLIVAVEAVGAMKHENRKEGASSQFRFGQGQGEVLGVFTGLGVGLSLMDMPMTVKEFEVPPGVWKTRLGMGDTSKDEVTSRAERDFPECARELRGPRGGAKHGRAEALYLAKYARFLATGKGL